MESRLAASHNPDSPGLPRGRSSLPPDEVRRRQRDRLVRAAMAAIAEKGYGRTTVADVVARARVSRKAFYQQFSGLEECFFTAMTRAQRQVVEQVAAAPGVRTDPTPLGTLQAGVRGYLELCAREPEFTRCIVIELPAVGERALKGRNVAYRQVAELLKLWREHAHGPSPVGEECYRAAVGAVAELVLLHVSRGTTDQLPALADTVVDLIRRILAVPLSDE